MSSAHTHWVPRIKPGTKCRQLSPHNHYGDVKGLTDGGVAYLTAPSMLSQICMNIATPEETEQSHNAMCDEWFLKW